jgi:D-alanyl-D-alanine carboxypeptidase
LRVGSELTLENALKMLMVKSANDVAVVIAEGLGGSVDGFATLMNAEARRLGMRESRFYNPHGLHHPSASTSARDMAILARAVLRDYPNNRDWWGIGAIQLGGRIFRNTNGLIGRYSGADGMKTGFICASGFNVVATASRYGKTLIAVVLGAPSASERTAIATGLFDKGFAAGGWGGGGSGNVANLPVSAYSGPRDMRYHICGAGRKTRGPLFDEDEFAVPNAHMAMGDNHNPALDMLRGSGGMSMASRRVIARGARAEFVPIQVFVGRSPGSDTAPRPTQFAAKPKPDANPVAFAPVGATAKPANPTDPVATKLSGKPVKLQGAAKPDGDDADAKPKAKGKARPGKKVSQARDKTAIPPETSLKKEEQIANKAKAKSVKPAKLVKPAVKPKDSLSQPLPKKEKI